MTTIVPATWADLGYAKLGPGPRLDVAKTHSLAQLIARFGLHDVETSGDERWIRDKARVKGAPPPWLFRRAALITSETVAMPESYDFLARFRQSSYAPVQNRITADPAQLAGMLPKDLSADPWKSFYSLALTCSLLTPDAMPEFLRTHALPNFFAMCPEGRVAFYEANDAFERRYGLLRAMYASSLYDLTDLQPDARFGTLREWQTIETVKQPITLFSLLGAALYPQVYIAQAGPIGLRILFILDPPQAHSPPPFPASWMSFPQSHWDFGQQITGPIDNTDNSEAANSEHAVHRRHRLRERFSADDIVKYVDWFADKFSKLSFHISDPCEFIKDDCVDPITSFECALTVDRVLRKAISCVAAEANAVRKSASQEIADLLETLRALNDPSSGASVFFKELHHPGRGLALVQGCLAGMPLPIRDAMHDASDKVYRELLETIRESVWVKPKLTVSGVMVKTKHLTAEIEEANADFVANVVRALRNAHHGYLSNSDPANRPSRYLALVTGNTPDSMAFLGVLWALSLVADSEAILGCKWKPLSRWD